MCGICGIAGREAAGDTVRAMNTALRHRGPDDAGYFVSGAIALGMSRLAILDLEGGKQPMFSEREDVVAIHNGEIYNHALLRKELERDGHIFGSATDSEVLVHGYEAWGADLFCRLEGMFASCIWDRQRRRLLIGRDRFGEKPLFYRHGNDGSLSFSSELNSLLSDPAISRRADRRALGQYMRMGFVPEPATAFVEVRALPAGHYLVWEAGQVRVCAYLTPHLEVNHAWNDDRAAEEACMGVLERAVRRQMMSDVPLGAFLSGGIDSSSVVAAMQRVSSRPVQTFTVRFEDQGYDESHVARKTASRLGTDHQEIVVTNQGFESDDLWRIVDHVGQPFYDSSALPTYLLCREVRRSVTVALTGDGGDEMFAGYPFFRWALALRHLNRLPDSVLSAASSAARRLAEVPGLQRAGMLRRVRRAADAAQGAAKEIPARVLAIYDPSQLATLLVDPVMRHSACNDLPALTAGQGQESDSPLRRLMAYRCRYNLPGDMLTKIDRMSMACSLELRAPLLDKEVAEFASQLPDHQLIRGGKGKDILRRTMRPHLPSEVFDKPKSGFSIPLHTYLNNDFHELAADLLRHGGPLDGVTDAGAREKLRLHATLTKCDSARQSVYRATHQYWALVMLAAWAERYEVVF